ncbi:hypothetical protein KBI23_12550 [bacterium]|nr:hypothetical protein [bacterium]
MKCLTIVPLLACLVITSGAAGAKEREESILDTLQLTEAQLDKNAKIVFSKFSEQNAVVPSSKYPCETICRFGDSWEKDQLKKNLCFLSRPTDRHQEIVAVLFKEANGTTVLNSSLQSSLLKIEYKIPPIFSLTAKDCDALWGPRQYGSLRKPTYLLVQANDRHQRFFIDLVFVANKIERYRIRNRDLAKALWVKPLPERSEEAMLPPHSLN